MPHLQLQINTRNKNYTTSICETAFSGGIINCVKLMILKFNFTNLREKEDLQNEQRKQSTKSAKRCE